MAQTEDRRRITVRLMVLQVGVVVLFAALAISFWFLQIVQHSRFEEMAANNHQRTLALRAPRGVLFDRNGQGSRREPSFVQRVDCPRAYKGPRPHHSSACGRCRNGRRGRPVRSSTGIAASRRTVRSSSSRTRRSRRWPPSWRGVSISSCRTFVVEQVPMRQYPVGRDGCASVRIRRRSQRQPNRRRHYQRRHRRPIGHRTRLQQAADGSGRRPARRRQQRRPGDA